MIDEASGDGERKVAFLMSLRAQGVRDLVVLRAMERVPRELFAPTRFADLARQDVSVPLPCGQTMTTPLIVANLLGALEVKAGARVLEVGTGSGYVAALLGEIGADIVSLERYRTLTLAARERLTASGHGGQVDLRHADGFRADRTLGRFERILVNGLMEAVPEALLGRLKPGGRLVGALRAEGVSRRVTVDRLADGAYDYRLGPAVRLPPLAPGLARAL